MSRSKQIKQRQHELEEKEKLILSDMTGSGSRTKKILMWSLGVGLITLAGYALYQVFVPSPRKRKSKKRKQKKKEVHVPKDYPIFDTIIEKGAPVLGRWILKELGDAKKSGTNK